MDKNANYSNKIFLNIFNFPKMCHDANGSAESCGLTNWEISCSFNKKCVQTHLRLAKNPVFAYICVRLCNCGNVNFHFNAKNIKAKRKKMFMC